MCGVVGIVSSRGRLNRSALADLGRHLAARGPDEEWLACHDWGGVALHRLAIVDRRRSVAEMNRDQDVKVVFNGEIWNYRELGARLGLPRSSNEYEVIRACYERHGIEFARHLEGMFAVVILDARDRSLTVARDEVGIKPLFVGTSDEMVIAASDPRPVAAALGLTQINDQYLANQLVLGHSDFEDTPVRDVRQLKPGFVLRVHVDDAGRMRATESSWVPRRTEEEPRQDDDTLLDRYLWLTRGAVERCVTHGDLKVGLLLSGGVDSTLLALLVGELGLTERVTAFSFGDAASPDLPWARWVAKHVGLRLVELPPRVDGLLDTLDDVAGAMVGYPAINIFALFQALRTAAPDLKVVMCGEGSDELFGGYPRIGRLPQHLAELQHAAERVGCTSSLLTRLQKTVGVLEGGPALLDWWMAVERSEQLVDAHLIPFDFGAMAFGCEVRVPFLDPRIWSLTCSLRTNTIVRPTEMKWLPKAMVRRLETGVPSELLSRRKVALPQAFAPGLVALRRDAFMRPRDVFDTAVGLPPFLHRWYAATARALNDVGTAA